MLSKPRSLLLFPNSFLFQLYVSAYDTFFDNNKAYTTVHINVTRNDLGPRFIDPETYFVTVNEYTQVGTEIFPVQAVDQDGVSIRHY